MRSDQPHLDQVRDLVEAFVAGQQGDIQVLGGGRDHGIGQFELVGAL